VRDGYAIVKALSHRLFRSVYIVAKSYASLLSVAEITELLISDSEVLESIARKYRNATCSATRQSRIDLTCITRSSYTADTPPRLNLSLARIASAPGNRAKNAGARTQHRFGQGHSLQQSGQCSSQYTGHASMIRARRAGVSFSQGCASARVASAARTRTTRMVREGWACEGKWTTRTICMGPFGRVLLYAHVPRLREGAIHAAIASAVMARRGRCLGSTARRTDT
jgi:hypothetical protein